MTGPITITLRGEPTAVGRPRFAKTGVAYTPERTRNGLAALRFAGQEAMGDRPPVEGPVRLEFRAELKIPASWSKKKQHRAVIGELMPIGRPDLDNYIKLLDALNAIVFRDDSQIVQASVIKRYSLTPQITITVTPMNGHAMEDSE
jgi:Holliday junction resolvase RusA-like endonuclease